MEKLNKANFNKARDFILCNARMIERRLFDYHFQSGPNEGVFHAVYAYRNRDGGIGHGMEPDTASPESQPLFTIMALEALDEAGCLTADILANDFMPYFERVTVDTGGIPWMLNPVGNYPRASHFENLDIRGALSTTAPLVGFLEKYGVESSWKKPAENFIWQEIERIGKKHAFCFLCVPRRMLFLDHCSDRIRAEQAISDLMKWIREDGVLCKDSSNENWGLYGSPNSLTYAPTPSATLKRAFTQAEIDDDLDETIRRQQTDGRWANPYGLSEGMKLEWAGIQTLSTLKTLKAYDRIESA